LDGVEETVGIFGAGALGTLLASRLARGRAGARIVVLVRAEARAAALRREAPAAAVTTDPSALRSAAQLFLCVKSYQTEGAARTLASAWNTNPASPRPPIVSLQNGWGHMEILEDVFPGTPLVAGTTTLGAYWDDGGGFHGSDAGMTAFAPWNAASGAACDGAVALFGAVGLRASRGENARDALWRKLVLNVAVNPLTAIHAVPNGALSTAPGLHAVAQAAAREAVTVGVARGHLVAAYDPKPLLDALLRDTAGNRSSMAEDVAHGRATEADAIVGAVLREGRLAGIATPVIASLGERLEKIAPTR
jgi:2-dehydropantoate 2-reductase